MATPSVSTWGDPTSTKHVLLIHGITTSSQIWHRVGQEFASRGYFVTAPDLPGHGNARRTSDYTVSALAEELQSTIATVGANDHCYDIVIGHSLGGVIASALLPHLKPTRPIRAVLVDPPLEQTAESVAHHRNIFGDMVRNPKTPEAYLQGHPLLTKEDATLASLSARLCDASAVEAILDQNIPWSFSHLLSTIPDNIKVTVLCATPSKVKVEDLKPYRHVAVGAVDSPSHLILLQLPRVVVETAFEGTEC